MTSVAPSAGRTGPPRPANCVRWGILGTSAIAGQFAAQLPLVHGAELQAVASRDDARAAAFASACGAKIGYGSYKALLANEDVDVVYVATPARYHRDHCIAALLAGKPVLCEKPFGLNADDALAIATVAHERGLFCMEAMWMRFSPLVQRARGCVQSGRIGQVRHARMAPGYRASPARLQDGQAGYGALLNFGVYGVSLAHFFFGSPADVTAALTMHPSGLDETVSAILHYPRFLAAVDAGIGATMPNDAVIVGDAGRLRLGAPFFNPGNLQHIRTGAPQDRLARVGRLAGLMERLPYAGLLQGSSFAAVLTRQASVAPRPRGPNGLGLEAAEVMRCLAEGRSESDLMSLSDSIAVMETLDAIRAAAARQRA